LAYALVFVVGAALFYFTVWKGLVKPFSSPTKDVLMSVSVMIAASCISVVVFSFIFVLQEGKVFNKYVSFLVGDCDEVWGDNLSLTHQFACKVEEFIFEKTYPIPFTMTLAWLPFFWFHFLEIAAVGMFALLLLSAKKIAGNS
jgi:NADH:ubiquinone oxidoreductase subunit K